MTDIILLVGLLAVFTQWMYPLGYMLFKKLKSQTYIFSFGVAGLFVTLGLITTIALYFEGGSRYIMSLVIGALFIINVLITGFLQAVALRYTKSEKNKASRILLYITTGGIIIISSTIISLFVEQFPMFSDQESFVTLLEFSLNKSVFIVMLLRMIAIAYVAFDIYIIAIYYIAVVISKDKSKNIDEFLTKSQSMRRLIFIVIIGVMLSFLHFAELDLTTISLEYNATFLNIQNVLHLITVSIFIPLLLDQLRNKNTLEKSPYEKHIRNKNKL